MGFSCHSPGSPLPCDRDQTTPRLDICIGTDPFHTPRELAGRLVAQFRERGYSVSVNTPFSGALVPMRYTRRESRVHSVMIEINRRLYLHNPEGFFRLRTDLRDILEAVDPETPDPEPRMNPEQTEPAGRVDLPDCGHVIVRLKKPE